MKILVCYEKHGYRYLDASTPEALQKSALKILQERYEDGYGGYDPSDNIPKVPELTMDAVENLPELYKTIELDKYKTYQRDKRAYDRNLAWFNSLEKELIHPEGKAWNLLKYRTDYQYENVELKNVE